MNVSSLPDEMRMSMFMRAFILPPMIRQVNDCIVQVLGYPRIERMVVAELTHDERGIISRSRRTTGGEGGQRKSTPKIHPAGSPSDPHRKLCFCFFFASVSNPTERFLEKKGGSKKPLEGRKRSSQPKFDLLTDNGNWRLIFTTGDMKTQKKLGGKISYVPIKAVQVWKKTSYRAGFVDYVLPEKRVWCSLPRGSFRGLLRTN